MQNCDSCACPVPQATSCGNLNSLHHSSSLFFDLRRCILEHGYGRKSFEWDASYWQYERARWRVLSSVWRLAFLRILGTWKLWGRHQLNKPLHSQIWMERLHGNQRWAKLMSNQTSTLISLDESKHYHDQFLSKFCYHFHFFIKLDHIHFISINFDQVWPVNHLISLSVFSRCVVSVVLTKQSKPFAFVKIGSDAKRLQHSCKLFYFLSELCFVAW